MVEAGRGGVEDDVGASRGNDLGDPPRVGEIDRVNRDGRAHRVEPPAAGRRAHECVHLDARLLQGLHEVGADEAGGAGDQGPATWRAGHATAERGAGAVARPARRTASLNARLSRQHLRRRPPARGVEGGVEPGHLDVDVPTAHVSVEGAPQEREAGVEPSHLGDEQPAGNGEPGVGQGQPAKAERQRTGVPDALDGAVGHRLEDVPAAAVDREVVQSNVDPRERQGAQLGRALDGVDGLDEDADAASTADTVEHLLDVGGRVRTIGTRISSAPASMAASTSAAQPQSGWLIRQMTRPLGRAPHASEVVERVGIDLGVGGRLAAATCRRAPSPP